MKMFKNGEPIEIPEGTWKRLRPDQKAMYTTAEGESTGTMTVETIQTVQKKTLAEVVVPVVEEKDDITGNPEIKKEIEQETEQLKEVIKEIKKPVNKGGRPKRK